MQNNYPKIIFLNNHATPSQFGDLFRLSSLYLNDMTQKFFQFVTGIGASSTVPPLTSSQRCFYLILVTFIFYQQQEYPHEN